jgi:hypothetical protein
MYKVEDDIVVPWFHQDDYREILSVMEDAPFLPGKYDWWLMGVREQLNAVQHRGVSVSVVPIEPLPFLQWCTRRERAPNAQARVDYVREMALQI